MTDLLVECLSRPSFSWGGGTLYDVGDPRMSYVAALRAADKYRAIEPTVTAL